MIIPQHCTNPGCRNFTRHNKGKWYQKYGRYSTEAFGSVQRFICTSCNRTFSEQTFTIDYYVKKPVSYARIHQCMASVSRIRNIAREMGKSPELVGNRVARMVRKTMLRNPGGVKEASL